MTGKVKVTIWGEVEPFDFDDNNCIIRAAIMDPDEVFFLKDVTSLKHDRLLDYVYERVKVEGFVEEDSEGDKIIEVIEFWPENDDYYVFGWDDFFGLEGELGLDQLINYQFELF